MNKNDEYDDFEEYKEMEALEDKWHLVSDSGEATILTSEGVKKYFESTGCVSCWKDFIAHMKLEKDDYYTYRNYTLIPDSKYVAGNYQK